MPKADFFARLGLYLVKDYFDAEACSRLRTEARLAPRGKALVVRNGADIVEEESRRTKYASVSPTTISFVYDRLKSLALVLQKHFNIPLDGCERPQFLIYRPGDYFRPHRDLGADADMPAYLQNRRISVVIFLNGEGPQSDPQSFGGGSLTFYKLTEKPTWQTARASLVGEPGLLIAFPAGTFHEVTPVAYGERFTIVTWFYDGATRAI